MTSQRLEFYHGANVYCQFWGRPVYLDLDVLDEVLEGNFLDMKNVQYELDITKEFTWDFKELVEIKKRKRIVSRLFFPTSKVLAKSKNVKSFERARREGRLRSVTKPFDNYNLYALVEDKTAAKESQDKVKEQHELNLYNAGQKRLPSAKGENEPASGRRIKKMPTFARA